MSIPPPPVPPPGPGGYYAPAQNDRQAVAALVCGIGGFLCIIPAIIAIVLGTQSRKRIDASGGRLAGRGMATAGMVLGIVWVGLSAVVLIVSIAANVGT